MESSISKFGIAVKYAANDINKDKKCCIHKTLKHSQIKKEQIYNMKLMVHVLFLWLLIAYSKNAIMLFISVSLICDFMHM